MYVVFYSLTQRNVPAINDSRLSMRCMFNKRGKWSFIFSITHKFRLNILDYSI